MFEFNDWEQWDGVEDHVSRAESYGIRTFAATHDNSVTATVDNHMVSIVIRYLYNYC
jgi:hypothetical protein